MHITNTNRGYERYRINRTDDKYQNTERLFGEKQSGFVERDMGPHWSLIPMERKRGLILERKNKHF